MAQYQGFKCDDCGAVISTEQRTKKTVKFDGPEVQGEYSLDLCPACVTVPTGVEMKPLRRRRKKAEPERTVEPMVDTES